MSDLALPLDRARIESILPHRDPFLFVDTIDELEPGKRAAGTFRLDEDAWIVAGHFPGQPLMPGVIVCEALAQVGAVCLLAAQENAGKLPLFGGMDKVRFKRQVRPGDVLRLEAEVTRTRGPVGWAQGTARVGGELACSGQMVFALAEREGAS